MNLRANLIPGSIMQLGSGSFAMDPNGCIKEDAWLLMDISRLIMLLSLKVQAPTDRIKIWFDDAKVFFQEGRYLSSAVGGKAQ